MIQHFFYDLFYISGLYALFFFISNKCLTVNALKISEMFEIDISFMHLNLEMSQMTRYKYAHQISTIFTIITVFTIPLVHSIIHVFFYRVFNILLLNRMLLCLTLCRVIEYGKPRKDRSLQELLQVLVIMITYEDVNCLYIVLFQLFDDSFRVTSFVKEIYESMNHLIRFENSGTTFLLNAIGILVTKKKQISYMQLGILSFIFICALWTTYTFSARDMVSYYYCLWRIMRQYGDAFSKNKS